MKSIHLSFTFIFIVIFFSSTLKGTHQLGGEITYQCTGNQNEYKITLKTFLDCDGAAYIPGGLPTQTVNLNSENCQLNVSITLNLTDIIDVTPLCPGFTSTCGDGDMNLVPGVAELIYDGVITVPEGCIATISYSTCCRNGEITNGGANSGFYISALLDNSLALCNNSPVFMNPASFYTCLNQFANYNHGAVDPDGDELRYSFVACNDNVATEITYNAGFSGAIPLSSDPAFPITINENTGAISFLPNIPQVGIVCVLVEEYRNGIKIGEVVRDIQFNVLQDCSLFGFVNSNAPVITSPLSYTAVAGRKICFPINATDVDGDMVTISSNNSLGGTFNPILEVTDLDPETEFCWTPDQNAMGLYSFTVTVEDENCPPLTNTYTFEIMVETPIPTLGQWGVMILGLVIMILAVEKLKSTEWKGIKI